MRLQVEIHVPRCQRIQQPAIAASHRAEIRAVAVAHEEHVTDEGRRQRRQQIEKLGSRSRSVDEEPVHVLRSVIECAPENGKALDEDESAHRVLRCVPRTQWCINAASDQSNASDIAHGRLLSAARWPWQMRSRAIWTTACSARATTAVRREGPEWFRL